MSTSIMVTCESLCTQRQVLIQGEEIAAFALVDLFSQSLNLPQGLLSENVYILVNGRKLFDRDLVRNGQHVHLCNRLPGGKGGFGSMLRAIGAQIEKTTNREACRDLSGRRLRDIAEEMRLKKWIAKQTEREQEKAARRKAKLERRLTTPRHEFRDPTYDKQRSEIPEKVNDALLQGLAVSKSSSGKRSRSDTKHAPKKPKLWLGGQEDFDEEVSSEEMETSSSSSLSSSEDSNEMSVRAPEPSVVDQTTPSTSTVQDNLPGTSKGSDELPEVPDNKSPAHSAALNVNEPITERRSDMPALETTTPEQATQDIKVFNLDEFDSIEQLETLGLDRLKSELAALGMKCGGTLRQRAERMFSVKGLSVNQIKPSLLAKPPGKPKN